MYQPIGTLNKGVFLFLLACVVSLGSCNRKEKPEEKTEQVSKTTELKVIGQVPEFSLTDQDGNRVESADLYGKPWIANFMFTQCTATCPQQTAELKKIQDKMIEDGRPDRVRLISISVDPVNDTQEVLRNYATASKANDQIWSFLTGPEDVIRKSISAEGFKLAVETDPDDPKAIAHSPMFVLVDPYLRIRGLYDSSSPAELEDLLQGLETLEKEIVYVPNEIKDPKWLEPRRQAQLATASTIKAYHDFTFADKRKESGITFRHKIVNDAGRDYKAVHYDHGTGIVVADIDGDDLIDIYFVNQVGPNSLWRNLGNGKFEDITESSGVAVADRIGVSAAFADIDNDGDPDLYVTSVRKGNKLFENLGGGKFQDISEASGADYQGHSSGAIFFDYDRDGKLDLFVTNVGAYTIKKTALAKMESIRGEPQVDYEFPIGFPDGFSGHLKSERSESSRLFRNVDGKVFEDVTKKVRLIDNSWTGDATPFDVNNDGWMDLYILNMQGNDQVYINREGKSFENMSRQYFPKTPWGSMGVKAFDFDNDGDLDLYLTDMHSDMSYDELPGLEKNKSSMQWPEDFLRTQGASIFGNAFFVNANGKQFVEASDLYNAENYWPWGLSVDDLNADGFDDVFITASMNFPFRYGVNTLLLNENGKKFRDSEFILGVEPRSGGMMAPWFELDLKGDDANAPVLDAIKQAEPRLTLPDRAVIWSALGSRSSVIFDLENDGDLDIVTNEMNHYPMVLVSNLSEKKSSLAYLKVKLIGTTSNRSGFGAVVRVEVDGKQLMKVKDGQSGYMSHSDIPLYFGLNSAKQVTRIEVTWPNGKKQEVAGPIELNRMITISEE